MTSQYTCLYCDKTFHFKDLYDNHMPTCEYFHRSKKERMYLMEELEQLPSPQEMFRLIQHLTKTCRQLEEDVIKWKTKNYTYMRKSILTQLNQVPIPTTMFDEWIKTFSVGMLHLQSAIQPMGTLMDGIKHVLKDRITTDGIRTCPERACKEKTDVFYIYIDNKWSAASSSQWHRLIQSISHGFVQTLCQWEDEHQELLQHSMTEKDKYITYLVKITGPHALKEKQKSAMKAWFIQQILDNV